MGAGHRGIKTMMIRIDAINLIREKVPNENLCRHMIAVGAIMKQLSLRFEENPDFWELVGILHDIDLGTTDDPQQHGRMGVEWLRAMGMPEAMLTAILAHAGHVECQSTLDYLLLAGDQLSGLITACALVKGRKLSNVTVETVKKRFKELRFAAGADRESIKKCEKTGISTEDFMREGLVAMQSIAEELGL